jgi:hypothetical protein
MYTENLRGRKELEYHVVMSECFLGSTDALIHG